MSTSPSTPRRDASTNQNTPRGTSVIVNVIDVLRCFTVDTPIVGVTQIADQVGLHKSSVSRILATLEEQRIVEREADSRKYRLGLGLIAITGPLLAGLNVRRLAFPILQELSDRTQETVALNVWDGAESVSVEQIASPQVIKHTSAMGSRYRTALSASVQIFLAQEPADSVRSLLSSHKYDLPDNVSTAEYIDILDGVRASGFSVNYALTSPDELGVAAPVYDHRGEAIACILIAAPAFRISKEDLAYLTEDCVNAARQLSLRMGFQPHPTDSPRPR